MNQLHVEAEGVAQAAPEVVWELAANADRYPQWGPWSAGGYHSPGDQDGVGAIRWFRYGRTTTVERVLESGPGRRQVYTVVKGIPVRNYRAEVTLVHRRLRSLYPDIVRDLIAAADRTLRPAQT